jgi:hypothetical protein
VDDELLNKLNPFEQYKNIKILADPGLFQKRKEMLPQAHLPVRTVSQPDDGLLRLTYFAPVTRLAFSPVNFLYPGEWSEYEIMRTI